MQYLLMIYNSEQHMAAMSPDERQTLFQSFLKLNEEMKANKHLVAGDRLQPTSTATTVRVRDGKPQVTDGPFAETREQLGGYYLIEAKDHDEATAIAARIPSATFGSVEVRAIVPM
jgi:hypothetical protein